MRWAIGLIFIVLLLPLVSGSTLSVDSVTKNPNEVKPGDVISLSIEIENDGSEDIEDIRVSLEVKDIPFAPIESSDRFLDRLNDGDSEKLVFLLQALPDADPGIYKIPIIIHDGEEIISFTSVTIKASPKIEVGIEEGNLLIHGENSNLVIRFVNTGEGELKFVTASIPILSGYDILSQDSFYIGNIQPDDFETVNVELVIKENIQAIPVQINYKDSFNNEFKEVIPLAIRVVSREEALELGLIEKSNSSMIAIIVAVVLVLFFIYRKIKRR